MAFSTIYLTVKVKVEHPDGTDAKELCDNFDYSFESCDSGVKIVSTEITEVE